MGKKRKARSIASRVHNYVNQRRSNRGLDKLRGNSKLSSIAEDYAHEMAKRDRIGHNIDGSTPQSRCSRFSGVSENVSYVHDRGRGVGSIAGDAVKNWMNSPGHRKNILREESKVDGVGCWISGGKVFLCHNFARNAPLVSGSGGGAPLNGFPEITLDPIRKLTTETAKYSERALETPWAPIRALDQTWWKILPERRQRSFTLGIAVAVIVFWLAQRDITPSIPATLTYGDHSVPTLVALAALVLIGEAIRWYR